MVYTSQNPDFVECVLFLFVGKLAHFNFLEGIYLLIFCPSYLVHGRVGSLTYRGLVDKTLTKTFDDFKVSE